MLTDYPDPALLENLQHNVNRNLPCGAESNVFVKVFDLSTYLPCCTHHEFRDISGGDQLPIYLRCYRTKVRSLM